MDESGKPLLPSFGRYVQIPFNCDYKITVKKGKPVQFDDMLVAPAQEKLMDNPEEEHILEYDRKFYAKDAFYPKEMVKIAGPFNIDDYQALLVHVCPFQYNSAKKKLIGYGNITINIDVSPKKGEPGEYPISDPELNREAYGNLFVNPRRRVEERLEVAPGYHFRQAEVEVTPAFVIADCAKGLGLFDQECNGYPIRDEDELYKGKPTCKAIDTCGIQAHAGYYMIGSGGKEFTVDIDKHPSLYLIMKAEEGTDTCLTLMVHEKKPYDFKRSFFIVGETPNGSHGSSGRVPVGKDCFTIKNDGEWHDYTYDLRKLQDDYPAQTVRIVQFYSSKSCNGIQHAFHFSSLVFKT